MGMTLEHVDSFRVEAVTGPTRAPARPRRTAGALVGRAEDATLRLTDRTVSQCHAELDVVPGGVRVRDLERSNGTMLHGVRARDVVVSGAAGFSLGQTVVRVTPGEQQPGVATSAAARFHGMIGGSAAMRSVYATLQSAASALSTVLLLGESGTGKELAAHALHLAGPRRGQPFEIVNCGGLPTTLVEAELFGHVRGAFTGAVHDREGSFERADGGTIFLDEIGELPLESQPKLLRVLEAGQFQRVGDPRMRRTSVRVVAATHRDLRGDVNAGRFRADLYYRLAVIQVRIAPLRERLEDLPMLAAALIDRIRRDRHIEGELPVDAALLTALRGYSWPGNVRELRNYLEQWLVLNQRPEHAEERASAPAGPVADGDLDRPIREARERFERAYLAGVLARHQWQIIETARHAGIDRVTLFRMMRRYGLERPG